MMDQVFDRGRRVGIKLAERGETIAIGESSSGGLIAAALLAVPGASKFFLGAAVVYTPAAFRALTQIDRTELKAKNIRSASEPYAALLADDVRKSHRATWGLSETGAAGPDGNPYGDPPGHSCIGVAGPHNAQHTVATGKDDRAENMFLFALGALIFFEDILAIPQR